MNGGMQAASPASASDRPGAVRRRPFAGTFTPYPPPSGYPYPLVFTGIAARDAMFRNGVSGQYYDMGLSAVRCLEAALVLAGRPPSSVGSILDFPCGHGRVARVLRARFPGAALTVCDRDRDGVRFCADHLRATGVVVRRDFRDIAFERPFDLVWLGSLITHLPRPASERLLRQACSWLAPDGVLAASSHGPRVTRWLRDGLDDDRHQLPDAALRRALLDRIRDGYGYLPNRGGLWRWLRDRLLPGRAYGTSLIGRSFFEGLLLPAPWRVLGYLEQAWADFHDVVVVGPGVARNRP